MGACHRGRVVPQQREAGPRRRPDRATSTETAPPARLTHRPVAVIIWPAGQGGREVVPCCWQRGWSLGTGKRHVAFAVPIAARLPLGPAIGGVCMTTLVRPRDFAHATDRPVVPPRFTPGLSTTHGGVPTGDPDVSPDQTFPGWLPQFARSPHVIWLPPPTLGARADGHTLELHHQRSLSRGVRPKTVGSHLARQQLAVPVGVPLGGELGEPRRKGRSLRPPASLFRNLYVLADA